jgi:hypothetical protein
MAKTRQISFRLPEDEFQKLAKVWARAKERTLDYAPLGDVVREAIGLKPIKVITEEERSYLSGRISLLPEPKHGPGRPVNDLGKPVKRGA